MSVITPNDLNHIIVNEESRELLRNIWYSDVSSYWETLRSLYPEAENDRDVCRAVSAAVWKGTFDYNLYWGSDA